MPLATQLRQDIADTEALIRSLDPRTSQFIVMQGDKAFQFEMVNRKPQSAKVVALALATRFTDVDAQMVARALLQPAGEPARAVPLLAALKMQLTKQQATLNRLEQAISVIQWMPRKE
ncbi:hypothetical protein HQ393_15625 [Chitinibacter bivalviorum]|uniref:Uncharacterized protein n=1 Tax=Chitinibacter bivalviorum TaxID=2739434 RepID=A0A7H9BM83_9NEIS|nr:hypothetical protein [Chitinibacter bivalviorum]QLG89562.1 hypothetical protein HQ393_15625 [Chitinibacter bivalviorum]